MIRTRDEALVLANPEVGDRWEDRRMSTHEVIEVGGPEIIGESRDANNYLIGYYSYAVLDLPARFEDCRYLGGIEE